MHSLAYNYLIDLWFNESGRMPIGNEDLRVALLSQPEPERVGWITRLRRARAARRLQRQSEAVMWQLSRTSPHLMNDLGLWPDTGFVVPDLAAQLADDVAWQSRSEPTATSARRNRMREMFDHMPGLPASAAIAAE